MDALIFAAGLGTRLRPLTNHTPKALVEVAGVPMLERVVRRLVAAGADRLLVNVAYLGEQVRAYVAQANWQVDDVVVSEEPGGPYETGGGLKYAAAFFRRDAPFLLHNADVLTNVDLAALHQAQANATDGRLATLACCDAVTSRYLLFDDAGLLGYAHEGREHLQRVAKGKPVRYDFCGVHAGSPALLDAVAQIEDQKFSIMRTYLAQAKASRHIATYYAAAHTVVDVGTHERLAEATAAVQAGRLA